MHLHLQQHHKEVRAVGLRTTGAFVGPERPIEAVTRLLEFQSLKAVEAIAWGEWIEAQRDSSGGWLSRAEVRGSVRGRPERCVNTSGRYSKGVALADRKVALSCQSG